MIVDLVRNDLGRVCVPGSVRVPALLAEEDHPGLSHLVSTVEGELRPGLGWAALLAATFPPGSVTGAPKLAALDHIARLEPVPRGVYCGAVGWVDADREVGELNVAIRTFWVEERPALPRHGWRHHLGLHRGRRVGRDRAQGRPAAGDRIARRAHVSPGVPGVPDGLRGATWPGWTARSSRPMRPPSVSMITGSPSATACSRRCWSGRGGPASGTVTWPGWRARSATVGLPPVRPGRAGRGRAVRPGGLRAGRRPAAHHHHQRAGAGRPAAGPPSDRARHHIGPRHRRRAGRRRHRAVRPQRARTTHRGEDHELRRSGGAPARIDARGADDALLGDTSGRLSEALTANVFVAIAGRPSRRAPTAGASPGSSGRSCSRRPWPSRPTSRWTTSTGADEVFLTSSVVGVRPIASIDGRALPVVDGPMAAAARAAFAAAEAADEAGAPGAPGPSLGGTGSP